MAVAVKELEAPAVVEEEVSQETVPSTDNEATDRQPETAEKVNLDNFKEFREYKSEEQKRFAAQERRLAALEARHQQELEQARRALEEKQLSELDDYGQLEYKYRKAEAEREQLRQALAAVQIEKERTNALRAIAQEASDLLDFSIPVDALQEAESPDQAWKLAASYKKQQLQTQAKNSDEVKRQREQKKKANEVEVGHNRAPTSTSKLEQKFKDAKTTTDLWRIHFDKEED